MAQMGDIFDSSCGNFDMNDVSNINFGDASNGMPNPEELHEHINSLLGGKLGRLANEITEETMAKM